MSLILYLKNTEIRFKTQAKWTYTVEIEVLQHTVFNAAGC